MKPIRSTLMAYLVVACVCVASFAQASPDTTTPPSSAGQPAEHSASELAKKLANPIAAMISVPFQNNFDAYMGPAEDGFRYTLNFQPVVPIPITRNWNVISRTIVPFIDQVDVAGNTTQTGTGDIQQSFAFSPSRPKHFVWGLGPIFLIPSASDSLLGTGKFGIGPQLVVLKQKRGWTYGALLNHLWSVAGDEKRSDVNYTFLQPFLSYTTRTAWTIGINTESSYDWTGEQWSVPIHFTVSKLVHIGQQPMSFGLGPRCWATSPGGGPQNCVVRFVVTALFPRKPR